MQAADTTLTRLYVDDRHVMNARLFNNCRWSSRYNQPTLRLPNGTVKGALYTGPIDCFVKIIRTEGPLALYKGAYLIYPVNRAPSRV